MKNRTLLILIGLVYIWIYTACGSENPYQPETYPSIDYDALYIAEEQPGNYIQIILRMSLKNHKGDIIKFGLSSPEEHQERLHYFFQEFKNDINLISNQDTIGCIDAHFERLHMDLPYRNFILTFKESGFNVNDYLLINDQTYSNQLLKLSIRKNHE